MALNRQERNRILRITLKVFLFLCICSPSLGEGNNRVCFKELCIPVELARTQGELIRGLQFRTFLDKEAGMLFIFPQSDLYHFWMRNTLFPLDIIWLDESKKVVYIAAGLPPCRNDPCEIYGSQKQSRYALEVNAGFVEAHRIHIGDKAEFFLEN